MELNDKVTELEDEIKILKNEVQAVLLDLRESYLDRNNPFNPDVSSMVSQPVIINQLPYEPPPIAKEEPGEVMLIENQESQPAGEDNENELSEVEEVANEIEPVDEKVAEPPSEAEPMFEQELVASAPTAHEEVKMGWRPEMETAARFKSGDITDSSNKKIDLATITGLSQWVTETVKRLGHERTEAILDIAEMMGHLAPELKNILIKFINPVPGEYSSKVATREYLATLIELDGLLGRDNKSEVALLYILCQENDHG